VWLGEGLGDDPDNIRTDTLPEIGAEGEFVWTPTDFDALDIIQCTRKVDLFIRDFSPRKGEGWYLFPLDVRPEGCGGRFGARRANESNRKIEKNV